MTSGKYRWKKWNICLVYASEVLIDNFYFLSNQKQETRIKTGLIGVNIDEFLYAQGSLWLNKTQNIEKDFYLWPGFLIFSTTEISEPEVWVESRPSTLLNSLVFQTILNRFSKPFYKYCSILTYQYSKN